MSDVDVQDNSTIRDLRTQISNLERQLQERLAAEKALQEEVERFEMEKRSEFERRDAEIAKLRQNVSEAERIAQEKEEFSNKLAQTEGYLQKQFEVMLSKVAEENREAVLRLVGDGPLLDKISRLEGAISLLPSKSPEVILGDVAGSPPAVAPATNVETAVPGLTQKVVKGDIAIASNLVLGLASRKKV